MENNLTYPRILKQDSYAPIAIAANVNKSSQEVEKYGFLAIKAMITSALIWITYASWVDIIQEYMLIKTPISLETEESCKEIEARVCFRDRVKLRLRRRLIFAVFITILTIIVAWWFHWQMIKC